MSQTPGATARGAGRMGRRLFLDGFLGTAVTALAAAVVYPVHRYISPPRIPEATSSRVLAGNLSELRQEGWKIFPFGAEAGILIEKANAAGKLDADEAGPRARYGAAWTDAAGLRIERHQSGAPRGGRTPALPAGTPATHRSGSPDSRALS